MSETQARVRWEMRHCEVITDNIIKCNYCPTDFSKSPIVFFTIHLYFKHWISELTDHPNREFLENNFSIYAYSVNAWCKTCGAFIPYKLRVNGTYLLQNHYEIFHSDNVGLFNTVIKAEYGKTILNNFIITDKKATCITCNRQINIEHLRALTLETLTDLVKHFFSHDRYDNNFFIFDKTSGNRFCFTCFFPNNFIIRYQTYYDWNKFLTKIVNYC